MTDITIPADVARAAAMILRLAAMKDAVSKGQDGTRYRAADLADLLDPPTRSLRDEVERMILQSTDPDPVLAVVRRHVEALPQTVTVADAVAGITYRGLDRDDVLRLLGDTDD